MQFIQASHYARMSVAREITMVVIHTMEAPETEKTAENVASWFAGPSAPQASAHYCVDSDSVVQCVRDEDQAWHAGPVNGFSIGVEHAGYAKQTPADWADAYSMALLERSAELVGSLCLRYGIPVVRLSADDLKAGKRRGLCGHADVTNGLQGGKGHWDPGPDFPWEFYLSRVSFHAGERPAVIEDRPTDPTPVLPIISPIASAVDPDSFVEVSLNGETWMVCPIYVAPVGIGEARDVAAALGYELPSPALVDAIWKAADLKIDANRMVKRDHDGTPATMNSPATHAEQAAKLAALVGDRELGTDFHLLAGAFKDVVLSNGKLGLYGWQTPSGSVIQPFYGGHALAWKDYSQGLRLVRKKA